MIDVIEIISSIEEEKKSKKIEPSNALYSEISKAITAKVKSELNQCVVEGKLNWHETLNSLAFSTKKL